MSASASDAELVAVGRIGKAHGLRGEVAVEAWSDDPGRRFAAGVVLHAQNTGAEFAVESARLHGERWLVRFAGVEDRNAAEALRGTVLVMPARERPPIEDPDEFYDSDLVGLHARDLAGAELGTVTEVVHSAGGVHLVVARGAGADAVREHLVPFVAAIVVAVDVAAGVLTVDAPEGLFDL
jgi:16S rRNA processing protein RimM